MKEHAGKIIKAALKAAQPDTAVLKALENLPSCRGKRILIAIGKAAWQMAFTVWGKIGDQIQEGLVITKYGHAMGKIGPWEIREAGHPVPDENSCLAAKEAIRMVRNLKEEDQVLFLISGGGSALFELPLIDRSEMEEITKELLTRGASITEINTIRKKLSAVKGGKFAKLCQPAQVYSVILSDIVGDPLDMIASGPAYPDLSKPEEAEEICEKYQLSLSCQAKKCLSEPAVQFLPNAHSFVTGSVKQLCLSAAKTASSLGYTPLILTDSLSCEAREAGRFLGSMARYYRNQPGKWALIAGGETVVYVKGKGKGGRNQEMVLAAADEIRGLKNVLMFSVGSDGTDGPTDAAGGMADGETIKKIHARNLSPLKMLENNDAYHALQAADGLIFTGPTGTNVNDLSCVLIG